MQLTQILAVLGLAAAATACTPGEWSCGNRNDAPGPDGAVFVCNSVGRWDLSAQCGAAHCCVQSTNAAAHCTC